MPVSLKSWHRIKVSRTGLQGVLEVDDQIPVQGLSKGAYTQLTLLQPLFVGGHPDFDITSRHLNQSSSYQGCVQKVVDCIFIGTYNFIDCYKFSLQIMQNCKIYGTCICFTGIT